MISEKSLQILEYEKILGHIASYAFSRPSKDRILTIKPESNLDAVEYDLTLTKEADCLLYEHCLNISLSFDDITEALGLLEKGVILNCGQLLRVARVIKVAKVAKKNIMGAPDAEADSLKELCNRIFLATTVEDKIFSSILSDSEVSSSASDKLASIRRSIVETNKRIRDKLTSYTTGGSYSQYLQDGLVTMRNNRYVIPVKTEYKSAVKGLIHDQSASGSTTFIEPMAVVEMNNDLRSLEIDEQLEIENILRALSYEIESSFTEIKEAYETLVQLDVIFAKAAYSRAIKGVMPVLNNKGYINIINGRHPLIEKDKVVPVSISLGGEYSTLVISGPNTGGKTVSLKLVGLLTLMAMTGLYIPATVNSEISVFDKLLCDIGDDQSIEENLSTFSSHLVNIIRITNTADDKSLILLDELGGGTDPSEGSALAIAVVTYLKKKCAKTIVTSHYKELKEFAYATQGINISGMDFDPVTFKPTYKLIMGQTATSNALEIANVLGLNNEIINNAKHLIKNEDLDFNNIIKGAELSRREALRLQEEAEKEYQKAKIESAQYEDLLKSVEEKKIKLEEKLAKSAKEVLGDYLDEAEELVEELKDKVKQGDETALFEARVLKKKLENMEVKSNEKMHYDKVDGQIVVGDDVYIKSLNKLAVVTEISSNRKECTVKMGVLKSLIKLKDLQKVIISNKSDSVENKKVNVKQSFDLSFNISTELNLIGKRYDEALQELEDYLYKAKAKGYKEVRIVHGKGAGVLRTAVQNYLKSSSLVQEYRLGQYGEGDFGVTVATLK